MAATGTAAGELLSPEERGSMNELDVLVMEEDKVVTAKWLCRQMAIPIASAKRIMKQYCVEKEGKVQPVWQVSGWLRPSSNEGSQGKSLPEAAFKVSIVTSSRLEEVSKRYLDSPVPHVYSVQKTLPVNPADLCVWERQQAKELASHPDATNSIKDNRYSAISFIPDTPPRSTDAHTAAHVPIRAAPGPADGSVKPETGAKPAGIGSKGVTDSRTGVRADKGEDSTASAPGKEEAKAGAKGGSGGSAAPKAHVSSTTSPGASGNASAAAPSVNSLATMWKNKGPGIQAKPSASKPEKPAGSAATGQGLRGAGGKDEGRKEVKESIQEEEEEEWFDDGVVDEAADFARLRSGDAGSSGGGTQKKPSKRMRLLHDEDEEDGEKEPAPEEDEGVVAPEGPGTLESAKGVAARVGVPPKSPLQGRDAGSMDAASEVARGSEAIMEGAGAQGSEEEPGPGAIDKVEQWSAAKEPLSAADSSSAVNVKTESHSQQGQSGKRKKVMRTHRVNGKDITVVEWETAGGEEASAATPGPGSVSSEPSGGRNGAGGPAARKGPKSSSGSPTENGGASKAAPARAKPAKPAAAKPGQGSITSFFKKR